MPYSFNFPIFLISLLGFLCSSKISRWNVLSSVQDPIIPIQPNQWSDTIVILKFQKSSKSKSSTSEKKTIVLNPKQFSILPEKTLRSYVPCSLQSAMPGLTFEAFQMLKNHRYREYPDDTDLSSVMITSQFLKIHLEDGKVVFHPLRNIRHANKSASRNCTAKTVEHCDKSVLPCSNYTLGKPTGVAPSTQMSSRMRRGHTDHNLIKTAKGLTMNKCKSFFQWR